MAGYTRIARTNGGARRRWRAALLSVLAGVMLVGGIGSRPARAASSPGSFLLGINTHFQWYSAADVGTQLGWITSAHLKTVRFDENWSRLEPTKGAWDQSLLAGLDGTIASLKRTGVRPIITFVTTPGWANGNAGDWAPPTNMDDYGTAIAFLANRYKTTNTIWEVWNEPDYSSFWTTGPNATQYASMVKSAYTHIKTIAPHAKVLAGSLNHNDQPFLRGMYAAGVKGHFDALSIHPYCFTMAPDDPDARDSGAYSFSGAITDSEATMASFSEHRKPIYITEMGWKVPDVSETARAQYMRKAVSIASSHHYVRAMTPYLLQDAADPAYSLIHGGSVTPTWSAYTTMHSRLAPTTTSHRTTPRKHAATVKKHGAAARKHLASRSKKSAAGVQSHHPTKHSRHSGRHHLRKHRRP